MFTAATRNRRRFRPVLDDLPLRIAPAVYLPTPTTTILVAEPPTSNGNPPPPPPKTVLESPPPNSTN